MPITITIIGLATC